MSDKLELELFNFISPDYDGDFEIQQNSSRGGVVHSWAYISQAEAKQLIAFLQKHIEESND